MSRKFRYVHPQQLRDRKGRYVAALDRERDLNVIRRMEDRLQAESEQLKKAHVLAIAALEAKVKDLSTQLAIAKSKQRRPPGPAAGINMIMGLLLIAATVAVPIASLAWPYWFPHIGFVWLIVAGIIVAAWVVGLVLASSLGK